MSQMTMATWQAVPSCSGLQAQWLYTTTDSSTTALSPGYFNQIAQQVSKNDLISLSASDGPFILEVTTERGTVPCLVTIFTSGGGGGDVPPISADSVFANPTGSTAVPIGVPLGPTMNFTGGTLNAVLGGAAGGDLTGTYPNPAVAANAVTYAKFQQLPATSLVGNSTAGTANAETITLGSGLSFSGSVLNATGGSLSPISSHNILANPTGAIAVPAATPIGNGLGFVGGALEVTSAPPPILPAQTLYGNPTGSTGTPTSITLGSNLSFSGSILNASGGGGGGDVTWNLLTTTSGTLGVGNGYVIDVTGTYPTLTMPANTGLVFGNLIKIKIWNVPTLSVVTMRIDLETSQTVSDGQSLNVSSFLTVNAPGTNRLLGVAFTLFYIGSGSWLLSDISYPQNLVSSPVTVFGGS